MGQLHGRILHQSNDCELVAVVDKNFSHAKKVARQWECEALEDHKALLEPERKVDAVCVATPTSLHHAVAVEFLKQGVHCLVEKPITETVAQAEELISLADAHGCVLQVGHIERYNAAIRKLRDILDKPGFIECHRLGPFTSRVADVGVVLDLMIHDLDIILQIVGSPIASMDAVGVNILTEKEDFANVRIKFENGCTANITASRVTPKPMRKIRIFQKDTYVSIDYARQNMQIFQRVAKPDPTPGEAKADIVRKRTRLKKEDMITLEVEDFLQTIQEGKDPTVTGQHARDALQAAVSIARLIEEQQEKLAVFKE